MFLIVFALTQVFTFFHVGPIRGTMTKYKSRVTNMGYSMLHLCICLKSRIVRNKFYCHCEYI